MHFYSKKLTKFNGGWTVNQEELKHQLLHIIGSGLNARAIAKHTNISYDLLAKSKRGKLYLCPSDAEKLKAYLDKVVIPQQ